MGGILMLRAFTGSAWSPLQKLQAFHLGAWRQLRTLKAWDGTSWRLIGNFAPALSVTITPSIVSGTSFGGEAGTTAATATPTGGQAPYTYVWALVSNTNPGTPFATSPASATTPFEGEVGGNGIFSVTITDALGTTATATVTARFIDIS